MTDPRRWSEASSDATSFERELVLAGQETRMPGPQRQALWSAIAARIPPPGPALPAAESGAAASGAAASSAAGPVVKALVVLALAGGGVGGGLWALRSSPSDSAAEQCPSVSPSAVASQAEQRVNPKAAERPEGGDAPPQQATGREARVPESAGDPGLLPSSKQGARLSAVGSSLPSSQLRQESQALLQARQAARAGETARALDLLEQARRRFPHGTLAQEREALTIEVLAEAGNPTAKQRAKAFLHAHPRSPHAADVRNIAEH